MNTYSSGPLYDREAVKPMWEELQHVGVEPLATPEDVDAALAHDGTVLVVINSVCGCAAGNARPGVALALQHTRIPDHSTTVFAGVDIDAVERARGYMPEVAPSSPSVGLLRAGKPLFALERRHIERMTAEHVAEVLSRAFDEFCDAPGPSVPPEVYERYSPHKACGSGIPRAN